MIDHLWCIYSTGLYNIYIYSWSLEAQSADLSSWNERSSLAVPPWRLKIRTSPSWKNNSQKQEPSWDLNRELWAHKLSWQPTAMRRDEEDSACHASLHTRCSWAIHHLKRTVPRYFASDMLEWKLNEWHRVTSFMTKTQLENTRSQWTPIAAVWTPPTSTEKLVIGKWLLNESVTTSWPIRGVSCRHMSSRSSSLQACTQVSQVSMVSARETAMPWLRTFQHNSDAKHQFLPTSVSKRDSFLETIVKN